MFDHRISPRLIRFLPLLALGFLLASPPAFSAMPFSSTGSHTGGSSCSRIPFDFLRQRCEAQLELDKKLSATITLAEKGQCEEAKSKFQEALAVLQKHNSLNSSKLSSATQKVSGCFAARQALSGTSNAVLLANQAIQAARGGDCQKAQALLAQARTLMTSKSDAGTIAERTLPVLNAVKEVTQTCHNTSSNEANTGVASDIVHQVQQLATTSKMYSLQQECSQAEIYLGKAISMMRSSNVDSPDMKAIVSQAQAAFETSCVNKTPGGSTPGTDSDVVAQVERLALASMNSAQAHQCSRAESYLGQARRLLYSSNEANNVALLQKVDAAEKSYRQYCANSSPSTTPNDSGDVLNQVETLVGKSIMYAQSNQCALAESYLGQARMAMNKAVLNEQELTPMTNMVNSADATYEENCY